jgi:hypothetical protein
MKRTSVVIGLVMLLSSLAFAGAADKWTGWIVDNACSARMKGDVAKAKTHAKTCAMMPGCEKSGYSLVTEDGKAFKLDAAGNAKVSEVLKATKSDKGLNVTVEGTLDGDMIKTSSVSEVSK